MTKSKPPVLSIGNNNTVTTATVGYVVTMGTTNTVTFTGHSDTVTAGSNNTVTCNDDQSGIGNTFTFNGGGNLFTEGNGDGDNLITSNATGNTFNLSNGGGNDTITVKGGDTIYGSTNFDSVIMNGNSNKYTYYGDTMPVNAGFATTAMTIAGSYNTVTTLAGTSITVSSGSSHNTITAGVSGQAECVISASLSGGYDNFTLKGTNHTVNAGGGYDLIDGRNAAGNMRIMTPNTVGHNTVYGGNQTNNVVLRGNYNIYNVNTIPAVGATNYENTSSDIMSIYGGHNSINTYADALITVITGGDHTQFNSGLSRSGSTTLTDTTTGGYDTMIGYGDDETAIGSGGHNLMDMRYLNRGTTLTTGAAGNNTVFGSMNGSDSIIAHTGDVVTLGLGSDSLTASGSITVSMFASTVVGTNGSVVSISGTAGGNNINVSNSTSATITVGGNGNKIVAAGNTVDGSAPTNSIILRSSGHDTITADGDGFIKFIGIGNGYDSIIAASALTDLMPSAGHDTIAKSADDNIKLGGSYNFVCSGGGDNITMSAGGHDTIMINSIVGGDDPMNGDTITLTTGGNNSIISYGADETIIRGSSILGGSDTINMSHISGSASLFGGVLGNNILKGSMFGNDVIHGYNGDTITEGFGNDTVVVSGSGSPVSIQLYSTDLSGNTVFGQGCNTVSISGASGSHILLQNSNADVITVNNSSYDSIVGAVNNSTLDGSAPTNQVTLNNSGHDTVTVGDNGSIIFTGTGTGYDLITNAR